MGRIQPFRRNLRAWADAALFAVIAIVAFASTASASEPSPNAILTTLVEQGVTLEGGDTLKLPPPIMPDRLDAAAQARAIESVADANHPAAALLRKSVVAPFVLKLTSEGKSAEGVGRRMDLYFIAYGDFDKITAPGYLQKQYETESQKPTEPGELPRKAGVLSEEELAARKLTVVNNESTEEAYGYSLFQVFDKVQVASTARVMQTRQADSVLFAATLDPSFADDETYPNRWWPIDRDAVGRFVVGEPHPYAGSGAYGKLTRLHQPPGAMFIEYHLVFNEPREWFGGANLIGSKLPILVQDNVRKFRRDISK